AVRRVRVPYVNCPIRFKMPPCRGAWGATAATPPECGRASMESTAVERMALLDEIENELAETARWTGRSSLSPRVRAALAETPREAFVDAGSAAAAYENRPLSIGYGQTISQPFIVAIMTELLDVGPEDRVLE